LSQPHTYEEVRGVVVDILLEVEKVANPPNKWGLLEPAVAEVFARREKTDDDPSRHRQQQLGSDDAELLRDVFWDLFRQGFITLGINNSSESQWPFFRLSHFAKNTLSVHSPYRFHDATSFFARLEKEVQDLSPEADRYLGEAVDAFYAGCLLASTVMLGVAAEAEFIRLVEIAASSSAYGRDFAGVATETLILRKIKKFQNRLNPHIPNLPKRTTEALDANFQPIQHVLRIARNKAGHPTGTPVPAREQVYVNLQLFIPFALQLMWLRTDLK
jgi:hypothetical protein